MSNYSKGIICMITSAFGFAVMAAFVKLAGDIPPIQKTLFRNLVSFFIAGATIWYYKGSFWGKRENQKLLLMRSFFGTIGMVANFYAIDHLILSDANMLNKLSPFFVIIFSAVFLGEIIKWQQILAVLTAFLGCLFILKPAFQVDIFPYIIGVISGIFAAMAYTCVRSLGEKEKYYNIVFYFSAFSIAVLLPFVLYFYEPMSLGQLLCLLLAGVFATIGQYGITLAYRFAPAREISIFDYTNIIFSAALSTFIFGQVPDKFSFLGYITIFAAAFFIYIWQRKNQS